MVQNVLISELVQRVASLEDHAKQSAAQNATLVGQNVELCQELAAMKKGMDKAAKVGRFVRVTRSTGATHSSVR